MFMRPISFSKIGSILIVFFSIFGSLPARAFSFEEHPCTKCHLEFTEPSKSVHAIPKSGCQACHMLVEGKNHPEQKDSIRLLQDIPALCYTCHDKAIFIGKSFHPLIVTAKCTVCHNPHQSNFDKLLIKDMPSLCYNCHNESRFQGKFVHSPVGKGLCLSCHSAHASNFSSILIKGVPDICFTCHSKDQFTGKYVHPIAIVPNGCNLCHDPHVSGYPHLLSKSINEVCINCHKKNETGRHIVSSLPRGMVHPIKGVQDPSNPLREMSCISCHNPHSSKFPKLYTSARICRRCHPQY